LKKIKLFTHTDSDGIGCAIVGKLIFKNIDISYCNYDKIDEEIVNFISNKEYLNYDFVYITDLSVKKETENLINNTQAENMLNGFMLNKIFQLFDHHPTAENLNKNFWCEVVIDKNNEKTCGTSLFYDSIIFDHYKIDNKINKDNLFKFVELVRKYDTWLWFTKYNDVEPKKWNDFLYILGKERFVEYVIKKIKSKKEFGLDSFAKSVLGLEQNKIDAYVEAKDKNIIIKTILGYNAGIVFAETYKSELGNRLAKLHPELDFIILIDMDRSISYRTVKENIDVGKDIAKVFGGGGHVKAAGSEIDKNIIKEFINKLFDKE